MADYLEFNRKNFLLFIAFTFVFSWLLWIPSLLSAIGAIPYNEIIGGMRIAGLFGPTIGGFLMSYLEERSLGVYELWRRGWHLENVKFLFVAIFLIPLLCLLSLYLAILTEGTAPAEMNHLTDWNANIPYIISAFFLGGPLQEEFGWRGYALDRLESKYNSLSSSLIIGVFWSFWHAISFLIPGTLQAEQPFYSFFTSVLIITVLFTWLYNNTNRSVLVTMIFHTSVNASYWIIPINYTFFGPIYYTLFLSIIVVLIIVFYGSNDLMRIKDLDAKMSHKKLEPTKIPAIHFYKEN